MELEKTVSTKDIIVYVRTENGKTKTTLGELVDGESYHLYFRNTETGIDTSWGPYQKGEIPQQLRGIYLFDQDQVNSSNIEIHVIKKKYSENKQ